jgi:branched-chain amino acid transport system ATP-binding protein
LEITAVGAILDVQGLTKRFGGLLAVNDLSFSVDEGQVLGVVGPNGSGKTTTFNLLTGFIKPDFGKVIFEQRDITNLKPHRIVKLGIARTFQLVRIFRGLSVYENIRSAALLRTNGGALDTRINEILSVIGLADKHSYEAASLPIGDLKRLEIGRALATNPRLLMLDEPFSGLSHAEVSEIAGLLRRLISQGLTVIIVEHVLRELKRLAQHVIVLDFGKKIAEGNFDEVISQPVVREAYLGGAAGA